MRLSLLLILFISLQQPTPSAREISQPKQQQPASGQQTSAPDQRGTEQSPLVVRTIPTSKTQEEAAEEAKDRNDKAANDRHIVWFSGALVIIGFLQFLVYAYQAKKLRETVESAGEQAEAMERHIGEAARSATAMETIAQVIKDGNKRVIRAYLTVVTHRAFYQEKGGPGQEDKKWQGIPKLLNTGLTAARKVQIHITSGILPNPIPANQVFPIREPAQPEPDQTVGAHQGAEMVGGMTNEVVPDHEVAATKEGNGKCLCVWGVVRYEDIFGDAHTTHFGQQLFWWPDNTIHGLYIPGQNDAD